MRSLPVGAVALGGTRRGGVQALQAGGTGRIVDQVAVLFGIGVQVEELLRPVSAVEAEVLQVVLLHHLGGSVELVVELTVDLGLICTVVSRALVSA